MLKLQRCRSSIEVIADILRLGEAGKTDIMYAVNMSYHQLEIYLNRLLALNLIDKTTTTDVPVTYRVTQKGLRLLKNIDSTLEMLDGKEPLSAKP